LPFFVFFCVFFCFSAFASDWGFSGFSASALEGGDEPDEEPLDEAWDGGGAGFEPPPEPAPAPLPL
jgi:hypothetical protein